MSDLLLNLDTALPPAAAKRSSEPGNRKHQRFVKRRHFLERKGFLKQKQLPARAPVPQRNETRDPDRDKKRPKVDRPRGPLGLDGAGKEGNALWEGGSARRHRVLPKENASRVSKDSGSPTCPPSGAPCASSGASARTQANCGTGEIPKASLLSEYECGLSSAQVATPSRMVAIDCEMVGTGPGGRNNDLARCSIVGYYGDVMYDKYVRPVSPITNYRTRWSGIRRCHMTQAVPFKVAQKEILRILSGKVVVGHAIQNDFKALKYFHPKALTRDTSKIPLLNRKAGFPESRSASLKRLTKQLLHRDIQGGTALLLPQPSCSELPACPPSCSGGIRGQRLKPQEVCCSLQNRPFTGAHKVGCSGHSSVEDAQATMELYKVIEAEWERHLAAAPAQD